MSVPGHHRHWEQLITRWQGPIYGYVRRMLRDPSAAADVTQEIFSRAAQQARPLPQGEQRPWLYRVATNAVYRHLRDSRRRRQKELEAAMARGAENPDALESVDPLEEEDSRRALEEQLDRLPSASRSLITMHYYGGLSQRQIAAVLELPRTTIASRLKSAVGELRKGLRAGGCLTVLPCLEQLMRSSPTISVPKSLSATLHGLGTVAGSSSVSTSLVTTGGILMSQKLWIGFALVVAVAVITGFGAGRLATSPVAEQQAASHESKLGAALRARDTLRHENEQLGSRLQHLQHQHGTLSQALQEAQDRLAQLERVAAREPQAEPQGEVRSADETGPSIDWTQLAQTTHRFRDVAFAVCDAIADGGGSRSLSPELQARRAELIAELERAAAQARLHTGFPMLDEEMLPHIMDVYLGSLLDLSDEQLLHVQGLALDHLARQELMDDATPLMAYPARVALLEGVERGLDGILTPRQREEFQRLGPIWREMKSGSIRHATLGIDTPDLHERLTREWRDHYRLTPDQQRAASQVADDYSRAARELLQRHGLLGATAAPSGALREQIDAELYELQRRFEEDLLGFVESEQRRGLRTQGTLLIRFRPGTFLDIRNDNAVGF